MRAYRHTGLGGGRKDAADRCRLVRQVPLRCGVFLPPERRLGAPTSSTRTVRLPPAFSR